MIFEKVVMTKKTSKGKSIFMDRFVEWMVKDIRGTVRKHHRVEEKKQVDTGRSVI